MAGKVPGWIERLLLPRLSSLEGEIKGLNGRFDGLEIGMASVRSEMVGRVDGVEKQISSLRSEIGGELRAVDERIGSVEKQIDGVQKQMSSLRNEMSARFDSLESKVTLVEDVTKLKIEMKALAEKVAAITRT